MYYISNMNILYMGACNSVRQLTELVWLAAIPMHMNHKAGLTLRRPLALLVLKRLNRGTLESQRFSPDFFAKKT